MKIILPEQLRLASFIRSFSWFLSMQLCISAILIWWWPESYNSLNNYNSFEEMKSIPIGALVVLKLIFLFHLHISSLLTRDILFFYLCTMTGNCEGHVRTCLCVGACALLDCYHYWRRGIVHLQLCADMPWITVMLGKGSNSRNEKWFAHKNFSTFSLYALFVSIASSLSWQLRRPWKRKSWKYSISLT